MWARLAAPILLEKPSHTVLHEQTDGVKAVAALQLRGLSRTSTAPKSVEPWLVPPGWPSPWHCGNEKFPSPASSWNQLCDSKDINVPVVAPRVDVGLAAVFMHCQTLDRFTVTL